MIFAHAASRLALVGALGLAVTLSAPGEVRAQAPAEQVLPSTTVAFLKVKDASDMREAIKTTQLGQLLADPAMKPLIEDIRSKLQGPAKEIEGQFGLSIEEILTLPQGEVSLAIVPTPGKERPVAIYAVADAGDNQEKMDQLMVKATEIAKNQGVKVTDEEYKGATLTVMQAYGDTPAVAWTRAANVYHYATDVAVLKDVLDNAQGRTESLATEDTYKAIIGKTDDQAQAIWFLNIGAGIDLAMAIMKTQDQGNALVLENQLELTGLDSLKGAGGSFAFNVGPYDQLTKVFVYAPGESKGLLPVFTMPKVDLTPEPWVPASASSYQTVSWDMDKVFTTIKDFIDTNFAQGMIEGIEQQIAGPQGQGLKFQRDIFEPLGDRVSIVGDFATPGDETSQRALVGVKLSDAATFQNTVDKILNLANVQPQKRQFEGTTIYEFEIPAMANAEAAGLQGPVSMAISKDTMFISTQASILEEAIKGAGPSLREMPAYRAVAEHLPSEASTLSFSRPEEQARAIYSMVKSGQIAEAIREMARGSGVDIPDETLIDPDKMPPFTAFEKYIAPGGGYGVMEEDGVTFTQFTLKKESP